MSAHYLAFDLGAESGRAVLGRLQSGVLEVHEVARFANEPIQRDGSLRWNIRRLWDEVRRALERASETRVESVGLDTWGVDYALIGEGGDLVEDPYHYRDARTEGMMEAVFERVGHDRIYATTGIQFMPINTLYQLYAASQRTPEVLEAAHALATIPDLLNHWLTGRFGSEYTNATTTQFVDTKSRAWATGLLADLGLPTRLLMPLVEPGTVLGPLRRDACAPLADMPVVAPACHDTGSAVAAIRGGGRTAFISSGTWSLLGTELTAPLITPEARDLNFTNEGGVCGTTRLLKNITGLWLLQSCRRSWAAQGHRYEYAELMAAAADDALAFRSLVDPDDHGFLHPEDMVSAIAAYCRRTGQPEPSGSGGYTRSILESLAFKYRVVLESLEQVTGARFEEIRIIGGGARNRLLNQFTADATGRTVVAGPAEATALGNLAMQMLAVHAVTSLDEAREVIDRSFPVERFEPKAAERWEAHYRRFREYVEASSRASA